MLFGIAVGQCRMSVSDFYLCELGEVLCVVRSFYDFEEQKEQQKWERARFIAYVSAKPHDSKNKIKKPSDILPFPWEQSKSKIDAKEIFEKAKIRDAANQKVWLEQLKEKGLL